MYDYTDEQLFYINEFFNSVEKAAEELAYEILANIANEDFNLEETRREKIRKYFPEIDENTL